MLLDFQFGEVVMAFTKAHIAKKVADDWGFIKGEAIEIVEKLLYIIEAKRNRSPGWAKPPGTIK